MSSIICRTLLSGKTSSQIDRWNYSTHKLDILIQNMKLSVGFCMLITRVYDLYRIMVIFNLMFLWWSVEHKGRCVQSVSTFKIGNKYDHWIGRHITSPFWFKSPIVLWSNVCIYYILQRSSFFFQFENTRTSLEQQLVWMLKYASKSWLYQFVSLSTPISYDYNDKQNILVICTECGGQNSYWQHIMKALCNVMFQVWASLATKWGARNLK